MEKYGLVHKTTSMQVLKKKGLKYMHVHKHDVHVHVCMDMFPYIEWCALWTFNQVT